MVATEIIQALFRWIHVIAGIMWIGQLYFFNFVNAVFAPTLDAESKKKVVPQLMPRALFWFRWGAAWTWVSGILLLALVFYHGGAAFENVTGNWSLGAIVMVLFTFVSPFVYEALLKTPVGKNLTNSAIAAAVAIALLSLAMIHWAGFSYRGYVIHIGAIFGTIMAFNVWFRIWPAQQKIITAVRDGQAPDAAVVALAGLRSKHNTYLSVPLVWAMLNQHTTFAASHWAILVVVAVIGWHGVEKLYKKSAKVQGF